MKELEYSINNGVLSVTADSKDHTLIRKLILLGFKWNSKELIWFAPFSEDKITQLQQVDSIPKNFTKPDQELEPVNTPLMEKIIKEVQAKIPSRDLNEDSNEVCVWDQYLISLPKNSQMFRYAQAMGWTKNDGILFPFAMKTTRTDGLIVAQKVVSILNWFENQIGGTAQIK